MATEYPHTPSHIPCSEDIPDDPSLPIDNERRRTPIELLMNTPAPLAKETVFTLRQTGKSDIIREAAQLIPPLRKETIPNQEDIFLREAPIGSHGFSDDAVAEAIGNMNNFSQRFQSPEERTLSSTK